MILGGSTPRYGLTFRLIANEVGYEIPGSVGLISLLLFGTKLCEVLYLLDECLEPFDLL